MSFLLDTGILLRLEFVFTLFRQSGMSDEQFAADKAAVEKDLETLKRLLEAFPA